MPSAKLTALVDLAGGQVPTDLCYIVDVSAGAAGSKKSTLNDFLQEITQNITDKSVGFAGGSVATVSAASKGKIRYNEVTQTFQASRNTAAYINFVVGSGSVTQVTVWNTSTDEVTGYASLIYDDSNKLLRLFASSFLPTMQVENSSATDPAMIRAFGGSGRHQVYNFGAAASVEMYRGTTGPTFPGSGADVGQIIMAPANSTSVNPTTVGGARILTTTTQATVLGVGGGVGMVIETAGNNETSRTRRFLINQHGCVVVGANGQGITGTYGGTSTNVVLGQLTTYNANAAIQCGNPFTGNDNITFLIQANSGQTQAIFQLQTSAGASLYSVGSSGSHTYIGIGGGVAVSPANQGRIYYDTVDQAFKVSQNGGSYRNMVFTAAGGAGAVQYNNGSGAVDGDTGFVWDSPSATLILGDASVLSGKILFRNSTNTNTLTLQPGATGANITLTLPTTDGNAGEFLQTDGSGVLSWAAGGGSPGGSNTQFQFNSSSAFGGTAGFTWNSTNQSIALAGAAIAGGANLATFTPGAHTAVTAEVNDYLFAAHTMTITGAIATQRFARFGIPTITAGSALTVTTAATLAIEGPPAAAGSAGITNPLALWVQSGDTRFDGDVGIGIANPTDALYIYTTVSSGGITLDGTSFMSMKFKNAGSTQSNFALATAGGYFSNAAANDMVLRTEGRRFLVGNTSGVANMIVNHANAIVRLESTSLTTEAFQAYQTTANTNIVTGFTTFSLNSFTSGASGFGARMKYQLETTTTADQDSAAIDWIWTDATHASRTSALTISIVNNASALTEVVRFGGGTNTLSIIAPASGYIGLRVASAAGATVGLNEFYLNADDTNSIALHSTFGVNSNGTAANGFGGQLLYQLESSTTNDQNAAAINWLWTDATHASRTAKLQFQLVGAAAALATIAEFDMDTTAGNTRFLIYDVDNGTLERVSVGVADSGGAGFKLLRIPN